MYGLSMPYNGSCGHSVVSSVVSWNWEIQLMRSLVTSIFLYACESWTLTAELPKNNSSHGNEVLPQDTTHLIQRPWYQRESPCQDPVGNRTIWRPPAHCKETQTAVVWTCLPFIRSYFPAETKVPSVWDTTAERLSLQNPEVGPLCWETTAERFSLQSP